MCEIENREGFILYYISIHSYSIINDQIRFLLHCRHHFVKHQQFVLNAKPKDNPPNGNWQSMSLLRRISFDDHTNSITIVLSTCSVMTNFIHSNSTFTELRLLLSMHSGTIIWLSNPVKLWAFYKWRKNRSIHKEAYFLSYEQIKEPCKNFSQWR